MSDDEEELMKNLNSAKLYVLRLEHRKWYVGKTYDIKQMFIEYTQKQGPIWTQLHRPLIIEYKEKLVPNGVDIMTKRMMFVYGMDNVRGGSFSELVLPEIKKEILT